MTFSSMPFEALSTVVVNAALPVTHPNAKQAYVAEIKLMNYILRKIDNTVNSFDVTF